MKSRLRFIRVVIAATVIILLLVRFVGKWRYDVATLPFKDVDSISVLSEHELVCRIWPWLSLRLVINIGEK